MIKLPQPLMSAIERAGVEAAIERHAAREGGLLPLLHDVQDALGYVPEGSVTRIAKAVNRSRAEIHGVVTFYHHFRTKAPGRHVLQVCRAEACQSMGAEALVAHAKAALGTDMHGTSADGRITLEPVYCLGNCACSPAIMVDGELHGRVDAARFDEIVAELRSEA